MEDNQANISNKKTAGPSRAENRNDSMNQTYLQAAQLKDLEELRQHLKVLEASKSATFYDYLKKATISTAILDAVSFFPIPSGIPFFNTGTFFIMTLMTRGILRKRIKAINLLKAEIAAQERGFYKDAFPHIASYQHGMGYLSKVKLIRKIVRDSLQKLVHRHH